MPSVTKKNRIFCLGPSSPPELNEPYNFLCEMAPYIEIRYAYSWGRGVQNADRLLAHTQQASAHTPKKNRRTVIRDVQIETTSNHMHYRNFWNVQRAKEQPGEWS